jgi:hypothetical protein
LSPAAALSPPCPSVATIAAGFPTYLLQFEHAPQTIVQPWYLACCLMVKAYLPPNKIGDHLDSVRQEGEKEAAGQLNQLIIVCKDSVMYYDVAD